ncbi:hypothetical protein LL946_10015 [Knoellia locipacati]|uniref:hypothetical protein n=1 Tax=Knoellia locipacati TaxID=882824 RepID=UPI00385067F8
MSDARTRAEVKAAAGGPRGASAARAAGATGATGAGGTNAGGATSGPAAGAAAPRDRWAMVRRVWPFAAMALALALWWPAGFHGRADWMHLALVQAVGGVAPVSGGELFLGALVASAVVSALVSSPWPKFGIAAGLTAIAWTLTDGDVTFADGERVVLAALAAVGMLLGLAVGARATRGAVSVAAFLALVSGLSPATWSRGLLLAVAVALPFWVATADRVAPTILGVVRVVVTWLAAVVLSISLWTGFGALQVGALADPAAAAPVVGRTFVDHVREQGLQIVRTAPQIYTGWIWVAVALAIAFVVAATTLKRRRSTSS